MLVPSTVAEMTACAVVLGAVNVAEYEPPPLSVTDPTLPLLADSATVRPVAETGLPAASRNCTVMVVLPEPAVSELAPAVTVEPVASIEPAVRAKFPDVTDVRPGLVNSTW
jgi:hypothetical protein